MAPAKLGQWTGAPVPEQIYMHFALEGWRKNPDKVAVIDINSGEEVTYRQLEARVLAFAGSLQALGVRSRTKVQFYADNCLDTLVALQAALFCSASVFLFKPNKTTKYSEYKLQTEEAEIEFIITDPSNYDVSVHELLADSDCRVNKVLLVGGTPDHALVDDKVVFLHQLPKDEFINSADVRIREDVLIVAYTSGSTGLPKGVMHSHYSFLASVHNLSQPSIEVFKETDRVLTSNSLTYITSVFLCSGTLAYGGTLILGNPSIDVDAPTYIERYQATFFILVECPVKLLLRNADQYPNSAKMVSSLRVAIVGGSVFPENLRNEIMNFFKGVPLKHSYGSTETCGLIACCKAGPELVAYVGFLLPHYEAKVLNDKGQPAEVGEVGELLCRTPQLTLGYWKRPMDNLTPDGFFATGDMVTVDSDGAITVVGRKKNFITCLNKMIAPEEIEDVLLQHPAVKEVVVVATPHPVVKEAPTAMVVVDSQEKSPTTLSELAQELVTFVASKLCDQKHLYGGVHFVDNLPKTASNKYARNEITKQANVLAGLQSSA